MPSELLEGLRADPGGLEAQEAVFHHFGKNTRALFDCFRELAKEDSLHLTGLARGLVKNGKHTLALVQYRKLVAEHPSAGLYRELALVYEALGKHDEASDCHDKANNSAWA